MFPFLWMGVYEEPICVAERIAGLRTAAAGTSGLPDSGGVAHGPLRRRGAYGLRGEAIGRLKTRGPRPVMESVGVLV